MNAFWTLLIFTSLSEPLEDQTSGLVWYPSLEECVAASKIISDTLPYDHQIECEVSRTMSSSMRPVPRPEGLGE